MRLKYKNQVRLIGVISSLIFLLIASCLTYVLDKLMINLDYPYNLTKNYKFYELSQPIDIDDINLEEYKDVTLISESSDKKDLLLYDPAMYFSKELINREYNLRNMSRYFSIKDYENRTNSYISQANSFPEEVYGLAKREDADDGDEIMIITPTMSNLFDMRYDKIRNLTYEGKLNNFVYLDSYNKESLKDLGEKIGNSQGSTVHKGRSAFKNIIHLFIHLLGVIILKPYLIFLSYGNLFTLGLCLYILLGFSIYYMDKSNSKYFQLLYMKNSSIIRSFWKMRKNVYIGLFLGVLLMSFVVHLTLSTYYYMTSSLIFILVLGIIHLLIEFIFDLISLISINRRLKNKDMEWSIWISIKKVQYISFLLKK